MGGDFQFTFAPFDATGRRAARPTHLCSWDPVGDRASWQANRAYATTEAFFLVSKFHDHLGARPDRLRRGLRRVRGRRPGADPDARRRRHRGPDSDHINNANMSTPPDGGSPTLQLFLFEYSDSAPFFDYNGDDAATVWHEYTHGLSNRLVVDEDGVGALNSAHAGAMGEAWSDWYAEDLLVREGWETDTPDVAGEIDLGEPSDAVRHVDPQRGDRLPGRSPPTRRLPRRLPAGPAATRSATSGSVAGGPEVHADGEIWAQTLWDIRTALVAAAGSEAGGSDEAEQLITMGMRLAPPEPSMLDMRNAILQADTANGGDAARPPVVGVRGPRHGLLRRPRSTAPTSSRPRTSTSRPPTARRTGTLRGTGHRLGRPARRSPARCRRRLGRATLHRHDRRRRAATRSPASREGTYAKLAVRPGWRLRPGSTCPTSRSRAARRPPATWRSTATGRRSRAARSIASTTDNTGGPFCGANAMIDDRDGGLGWRNRRNDEQRPRGRRSSCRARSTSARSASIRRPPAATARRRRSRATRLEVSSDGTTFRPYCGRASSPPAQAGQVNRLAPAGERGEGRPPGPPDAALAAERVRRLLRPRRHRRHRARGVRRREERAAVRLADRVAGVGETGQAVDARRVVVHRSRHADHGLRVGLRRRRQRRLDDDDATTSHAYRRPARSRRRSRVRDEDGAGSASTTVRITAPRAPPPVIAPPPAGSSGTPTALPVLAIARSGSKGRFTLRVTCAERCSLSGKVTVTRKAGAEAATDPPDARTVSARSARRAPTG